MKGAKDHDGRRQQRDWGGADSPNLQNTDVVFESFVPQILHPSIPLVFALTDPHSL